MTSFMFIEHTKYLFIYLSDITPYLFSFNYNLYNPTNFIQYFVQ